MSPIAPTFLSRPSLATPFHPPRTFPRNHRSGNSPSVNAAATAAPPFSCPAPPLKSHHNRWKADVQHCEQRNKPSHGIESSPPQPSRSPSRQPSIRHRPPQHLQPIKDSTYTHGPERTRRVATTAVNVLAGKLPDVLKQRMVFGPP